MKMLALLPLLAIGGLLSGCTTLLETALDDSSREETIYLDKGGVETSVASTLNQTAERRNIIFTLDEKDGQQHLLTCAEQPPDVAISKELTEKIAATLTNTTGQQSLEVAETLKEALKLLTTRTADLEMLRVSFFNNCLAAANHHISDDQFAMFHGQLIDAVEARIKSEANASASTPSP